MDYRQLDVATGLEYLHYGAEREWSLVHDDLNPDQILLNDNRCVFGRHAFGQSTIGITIPS